MTPEELREGLDAIGLCLGTDDCSGTDYELALATIAALRGMWVVGYADPNSIAAMLSDEYSMITIERSTEYREDVPLYTLEPPT